MSILNGSWPFSLQYAQLKNIKANFLLAANESGKDK
jgi:hypothetical protein